ncbi:leucine-rich repeat-containing G protein-coupled receptor 1 isoform 1-T8 [Glossina fuscipes fuscipes]
MSSTNRKQKQRSEKLWQHSQYHRRQHNMPNIPKMQQQSQLRVHQILRFLLLLVCFGCHSQAVEYSVELSNCYDKSPGSGFGSVGGTNSMTSGWAPIPSTLIENNNNKNSNSSSNNDNNINNNNGNNNLSETAAITDTENLQLNVNLRMTPTLTPAIISSTPLSGWKCCCWNATHQAEVECRCEGEALTRIPQTLSVPLQRLTIASAGLPRLRNTGLKVYATTLLDIILTDLTQLETIQNGAFASLKLLRTIYISHAPKLTYLSKDVFQGISSTIKIVRIINSGLTKVPDLIHLPPANILQMLDLDNNHITRIDMKSISIKTEQLILANNEIRYIDDSAFYGSQIATLTLKGNRKLRDLNSNAFNGIMNLQELDLSSTSLIRLPSVGLEDIETLRIQNTHTLKTIPSIYYFKNLQKAFLTHSFHCCAFKFPSRHDPRRHAERMKEIEKWQLQCAKTDSQRDNHENFLSPANVLESSPSLQQPISANTFKKEKDTPLTDATTTNPLYKFFNENSKGVFYSRLMRSEFPVDDNDVPNSWRDDGVQYSLGWDYLADSMDMETGTFHAPIDTNQTQLDEYCGNFTIRKHDVECYPIPNALNPCEDVMGYRWLRIAVWIVVALAVVGNVAVLVVILSIRSEVASVSRFLMGHLAFADLCLGLYLLLIASIDAHSMGEYFNFAYDWQYGAGCKVAGFLTVFASHLSVFTLTVITIERWMAITHALHLNYRIKLKQAGYVMTAGWFYSIIMSSLPLSGISNYSSTSICLPMEDRDTYDTIYLVIIMGLNGVAFFIIALCYAQIYMSLGKETRQAHGASMGEMSVAKKMALLVFTNFACWSPIAFFGLTALAGYPLINVTKSKILLVFFYPLNSCADPYLYAILTQQYRQDLYTLLGKFGLCQQRALKYKNSISYGVSSTQRNSSMSQKTQQGFIPETQFMLKNKEDFV